MSVYTTWAMSAAADMASIYADAWEEVAPEFADLAQREESGHDITLPLLQRVPALSRALEAVSTKAHDTALTVVTAIADEAGDRALQELRDDHGEQLAGLLAGVLESHRQQLEASLKGYLSKYQAELTTTLNRILRGGQLQGDSIKKILADLEKAFGVFTAPSTNKAMLSGLTGTAAKVARAVFDQLQRSRSDLYQSAYGTGDFTGINITAGPGPCPSRICPTRAGKYMGQDALAELKRWPRHPWCKCTVSFLTSTQEEN